METKVKRSTRRYFPVLFIVAVILTTVNAAPASSPEDILWIDQFGTSVSDGASGVAVDQTGVYVMGSTKGALPGQTNHGNNDAYIRKYDTDGTELWTRQFGSSEWDIVRAVTIDPSGIYVTGLTNGAFPGQTFFGEYDVFIRKYDHDGIELWTRQFGTAETDGVNAVAVGTSGLYVVGATFGSLTGQPNGGLIDVYIRKYSHDGTEIWTRQFGASGRNYGQGVAVDQTGVYVTGSIWCSPGQTGDANIRIFDAFIRKYDHDGNEFWTRQFGTPEGVGEIKVAVNLTGVYVAGYTYGALPGQTSYGLYDAFIRKYDTDGVEFWTRQFGTPENESGVKVAADLTGVYVHGSTFGTLPGQTSNGGRDGFVKKYNSDGADIWTRQFGSSDYDSFSYVAAVPSCLYVAGSTSGTLPGQTSYGSGDAFIVKFEVPFSVVKVISVLIEYIENEGLHGGLENSLTKKIENVISKLEKEKVQAAVNQLRAFINQVEAQRGKKKGLSDEQADILVSAAEMLIDYISGQGESLKRIASPDETDIPEKIILSHNSPNPFNPVTTIGYDIPDGVTGTISLKVYDTRGALIRTLVDGVRSPGRYSSTWNGRDTNGKRVSSGVYLYRLQAGDFTESKKMILVR
ncbi:SBBP repeat-containing protein [Candidatus Omnitrophota bacterium]